MDNGETPPEEMVLANRRFKKAVLDVMFSMTDTFYIHCTPNPLLDIGRRGLVDREKNDGIILVFGPYSTRNLTWDDNFIICEMQFSRWENVRIPFECISRIFDKAGHVAMQWATMVSQDTPASTPAKTSSDAETPPPAEVPETERAGAGTSKSRVIEVDFSRKKPRS